MAHDYDQGTLLVQFFPTLTGEWEKDKDDVQRAATQRTTAKEFYNLAVAIQGLFNILSYSSPAVKKYPQRSGLLLKVYGELYPIAYFARLFFQSSDDVVIQWVDGSQNYDANVFYKNEAVRHAGIDFLEVTTLQDQEDAKQLEELSHDLVTVAVSESAYDAHKRKLDLLRRILKKKGGKKYPPNTALLVFTDEDRFRPYYFGMEPPAIDKKGDYESVLNELSDLFSKFNHVFVFSKTEIYASWSPPLS